MISTVQAKAPFSLPAIVIVSPPKFVSKVPPTNGRAADNGRVYELTEGKHQTAPGQVV